MSDVGLSRCSQLEGCVLWQILDATRNLAAPMGIDEVLQTIIASALQFFDAERSSVFLYDAKTDELYIRVATGNGDSGQSGRLPSPQTIRFPADRGIAGETAKKRRLINVPDCYADPRFNRDIDRQTGYVTRCLLSVPLLGVDQALVGVLQVLNKRNGSFNDDDEKIATIMAAHCAVVLQKAMLLEEYVLKQKMQRDLALAREIQTNSLPQELPVLAGYDLAAWSRPADETGGDIYDSFSLSPERVALLMADATGHGIGPALSVSQFRAMFRMGMLLGANLGELMAKINVQLKDDLPSGRFVTAFAGILDCSQNKILYHSGGQAPLMHFHAAEDRVEWLDASAMPLGILAQAPMIPPPPVYMQPGDIFGLISDGFFEYCNPKGEQFGKERVETLIRAHGEEPLERLRSRLCAEVSDFAAGAPQEDDMTIVLARRKFL